MQRTRFSTTSNLSNHTIDLSLQNSLYEIPRLDTNQIIKCLHELNIYIVDKDLIHPSSSRIILLYESLLYLLMPWRVKYIQQLRNEEEDLHRDNSILMALFIQIKILLNGIQYQDFTLQDITQPDPERLRDILSAIINYVKFRDEMWKVFEPQVVHVEDVASEAQKLQDEVNKLKNLRLNKGKWTMDKEVDVHRLEKELAKDDDTIKELQKVADELDKEVAHQKMIRSSYKKEMMDQQIITLDLVNELERLTEHLKYNDEEKKENLKRLEETIKQSQLNLDSSKKSFLVNEQKYSKMVPILENVFKCLEHRQNISKLWKNEEKSKATLAEYQKKITINEKKCEDIETKTTHQRRLIGMIEAKSSHLKEQLEKKRESFKIHMSEQTEMIKKAEEDRSVTMEEVLKTKEKIRELQEKIQNERRLLVEEVNGINELTMELSLAAEKAFSVYV